MSAAISFSQSKSTLLTEAVPAEVPSTQQAGAGCLDMAQGHPPGPGSKEQTTSTTHPHSTVLFEGLLHFTVSLHSIFTEVDFICGSVPFLVWNEQNAGSSTL